MRLILQDLSLRSRWHYLCHFNRREKSCHRKSPKVGLFFNKFMCKNIAL